MGNPFHWIGEQMPWNWDVSRSAWWSNGLGRLRSFFTAGQFISRPVLQGTTVNYDLARSLYRNDNEDYLLGAHFVKPIIDLMVEYMGLPHVATGDNSVDAFLNECVHDYWGPQIQQMYRDSLRDSKVLVRYYQPRFDNPLHSSADHEHGYLEILPPESVTLFFDPVDKDFLIRAQVTHEVEIDERTPDEIAAGRLPRLTVHEVIEDITPSDYTFYDKSAGAQLDTWTVRNTWKFVPIWPAWNEYAADLGGGSSELESVEPLIRNFHEVLKQALTAHKLHSIPKIKFTVKSVEQFLANNWDGVVDPETGKVTNGAKIQWEGKEILFFQPEENADYIEARSVLGDSATLLGFLLDLIAIASQTPKWALLDDDTAPRTGASTDTFKKKIERKRVNYEEPLKMILKMALVATGKVPNTPTLHWPHISVEDFVSKGQAVQQLVLALDVATSHQWIADETAMRILGSLFPEMNEIDAERELAADNVLAVPPPAPASPSQALPPASSNGNGTKQAAQKALTTTAASRS